jgi:hypothetical protein
MPEAVDKETGLLTSDWLNNLIVTELLDDSTLLRLSPAALQLVKINLIREISGSGELKKVLQKRAVEVAKRFASK